MKLTSLLGALAGVAVLALPLSAHAADYERFSATDPAHADSPEEPATAGVDLVKVTGKRTDQTITLTETLRNFRTVDASRRFVVLVDDASRKGRLLEYRTTPAGRVQTEYYVLRLGESGLSFVPSTCRGFGVEARRTKDQLVFSLPARCYPGRDSGGARLSAATGRWTAESWQPGPIRPSGTLPSEQDSVNDFWSWSGEAPPPSLRPMELF